MVSQTSDRINRFGTGARVVSALAVAGLLVIVAFAAGTRFSGDVSEARVAPIESGDADTADVSDGATVTVPGDEVVSGEQGEDPTGAPTIEDVLNGDAVIEDVLGDGFDLDDLLSGEIDPADVLGHDILSEGFDAEEYARDLLGEDFDLEEFFGGHDGLNDFDLNDFGLNDFDLNDLLDDLNLEDFNFKEFEFTDPDGLQPNGFGDDAGSLTS